MSILPEGVQQPGPQKKSPKDAEAAKGPKASANTPDTRPNPFAPTQPSPNNPSPEPGAQNTPSPNAGGSSGSGGGLPHLPLSPQKALVGEGNSNPSQSQQPGAGPGFNTPAQPPHGKEPAPSPGQQMPKDTPNTQGRGPGGAQNLNPWGSGPRAQSAGPPQLPTDTSGSGYSAANDATKNATKDAAKGAAKDATKDATKSAAKDAAGTQVPGSGYLDAVDGRAIKDAHEAGGGKGTAEEVGAQVGDVAARAAADYFSGGQSSGAGVDKEVGKLGRRLGGMLGKFTYFSFRAQATIVGAVLLVLLGAVVVITTTVTGQPWQRVAPEPTPEQCATMPDGWCQVLYSAQRTTHRNQVPVPWTVLAGVVKVTTDFGNTSPYDTEIRFPDREVPAWLAENFPPNETAAVGTGHVPYQPGSLAWGGHENGKIPLDALASVPWQKDIWVETATLAALVELNEAYKKDHGGKNIGIVSGYRSYERQVQVRADWCARGACSNAAQPGTSNHGWAKAIDFKNFGGLRDYSQPNFKWMQANGPKFGFHHPPQMGPQGRGPYEPWHWEYRGVLPEAGSATAATFNSVNSGVTAASCPAPGPQLPIGGKAKESSGPFLVSPAVTSDPANAKVDWQDPCQAAEFVAQALSKTANELEREGLSGRKSEAGAAEFWKNVIDASGVVTAPTLESQCSTNAMGEDAEVGALIDALWTCQLREAPQLHVVSDVTQTDGVTVYNTYSRADAEATLLAEARTVAWNFSKFGADKCSENSRKPQGVFPLTAGQMAQAGLVERCDPVQNIKAAAKLVVEAEQVPARERQVSATEGPYAPMMSGWAQLPEVLGQELNQFGHIGPARSWVASHKCSTELYAYLVDVINKEPDFALLAGGKPIPKNSGKWERGLTMWPKKVTAVCDGSAADIAMEGAKELEQFWEAEAGVAPGRVGEKISDDADDFAGDISPEQYDQLVKEQEEARAAEKKAAEQKQSAADREREDLYARAEGVVNWLGHRARELRKADELARPSMVSRLSSTTQHLPSPPRTGQRLAPAGQWLDHVVEWAIFYGGIASPYDTHGQRTGSLLISLNGNGMSFSGVGASTSEKIQIVLDTARSYLGVDYKLGAGGADGPTMVVINGKTVPAFDCSGFTQHAYAQAGYVIGRDTQAQKDNGEAVASLADALPGDLIFFGSPRITHVALYLGDNKIIHATKPGDVVKIGNVYETPSRIRRIITETERGGDLNTWIDEALAVLYANNFPKGRDDVKHLKIIIEHESSGNPAAVNNWDVNAQRGTPSFGLMQTIEPTFAAYALPGYTNRDDPVAQIIAGARYAQARYGGLGQVPGILSVARGEPYVGY